MKLDKTGSGKNKMARSNLLGNAAWCQIKDGKFFHLLSNYKFSEDSAIRAEVVG